MQIETKAIAKDKRFVPISAYCKLTGLSYATVNHMCNSGQLNYITTESGQRRIDTKTDLGDNGFLFERLDKTEKMLSALCKQFNISV